jgi:two-component SAPR family response regulator
VGDVECWFDVEEFEALVERAQLLPSHDRQAENLWRRAVALYQGDFLIGVERDWCSPKREAFRRMYFEALVGVGRCHEVRKEFEDAVEWYRRALEVNPLRDDIQQRIVDCCAETGLRLEAVK